MANVLMNKKDEIIMKLVHYFITEENYTPIVVNGVKDEIWLENSDGPYRIVRINSNYIHNDEQYRFDIFKTKNIMKQIKKKTMSFNINALNILLDINDSIELKDEKNINAVKIDSIDDVHDSSKLKHIFPSINSKLIDKTDGLELMVNVTKEINQKTEKDNEVYERTFKPKKPIITPIIIAINILVFVIAKIMGNDIIDFVLIADAVKMGQVYRLITCAFIHLDVWHLLMNMYMLNIIGSQIEGFVGKSKYIAIYLISAVCGSLMSSAFLGSNTYSIGASGALFGLMGALLYFGYHYRLYLGQALRYQIVPLIALNLLFGMMVPGIDMAAHVGGLVGGLFTTIALGIEGKSKDTEKTHGKIISILYILFLILLVFVFKK